MRRRIWEQLALERATAQYAPDKRERLESWGKSGHDYGNLTVKGFLADIFQPMEEILGKSWAPQIGLKITSDQKTEFHRWLGPPPILREWLGDRQAKGMPIYELVVTNKLYEATLDLAPEDFRFDKSGQLSIRLGELGTRASQHWEQLATAQLELNALSYDGQALFASTHTFGGDSPTMRNDLTSAQVASLGFAAPTAPTASEMAAAIVDATQQLFTFRDHTNSPINGGINRVLVMVPPNMHGAAVAAVRVNRLSFGQDNPLQFQNISYDVVVNPWLGATVNSPANANRIFYIFRADSRMKPLILQEAVAPEIEFQGPGSHTAFISNKFLFGIKAERAVGNGAWEHSLRCTAG